MIDEDIIPFNCRQERIKRELGKALQVMVEIVYKKVLARNWGWKQWDACPCIYACEIPFKIQKFATFPHWTHYIAILMLYFLYLFFITQVMLLPNYNIILNSPPKCILLPPMNWKTAGA